MFRYWSNLIFSVVVLFCVSVLVCVNIYTARSMCCCMFAPFCLRVYLSLFLAILCCPPRHTPTLTSLYTHTHTRVKAQLTDTHTPPHLHVCSQFFFALTSCLVSLQSWKASDQTKSIESKTDSIGSGRAIPIKQVRHRIRTLII